jgi:hypothetical protein
MAYFVEFYAITKILSMNFKRNYQKSQKNPEILPKVIKITKSGHTGSKLESNVW